MSGKGDKDEKQRGEKKERMGQTHSERTNQEGEKRTREKQEMERKERVCKGQAAYTHVHLAAGARKAQLVKVQGGHRKEGG